MAGPSKKSPRPSITPEHLLVFVQQLRLRADAFHTALQDELRALRTRIDEQRVRRAKIGMTEEWAKVQGMSDDTRPAESKRVASEHGREQAEEVREEADRGRDTAEEHRAMAESARTEAEQFRVLAEEARAVREQYREQLEFIRQEREALRHAAEEARQAAEEARHATIAAVAATADTLSANLAQMQFLEDARTTLKQFKTDKPGDVQ